MKSLHRIWFFSCQSWGPLWKQSSQWFKIRKHCYMYFKILRGCPACLILFSLGLWLNWWMNGDEWVTLSATAGKKEGVSARSITFTPRPRCQSYETLFHWSLKLSIIVRVDLQWTQWVTAGIYHRLTTVTVTCQCQSPPSMDGQNSSINHWINLIYGAWQVTHCS